MSKKVLLIGLGILVLAVIALTAATQGQSTIATALANQKTMATIEAEAREYGLLLLWSNEHECMEMIVRSMKNPELKKALLQAKRSGVDVYPTFWPWLTAGWVSKSGVVHINTLLKDERIIAFLIN